MAEPSTIDREAIAWRQYTMQLDTKEDLPVFDNTIEGVIGIPGGILAVQTFDECTHYLLFFNLHTRCEINRMELPEKVSLYHMVVVDTTRLVLLGSSYTFEYFSQVKSTQMIAMVFTSEDGFRNYSSSEVIVQADLPNTVRRFPQFCVPVGDGFAYMLREPSEPAIPCRMHFFYVPYADLCRVADSPDDSKMLASIPAGAMPLQGSRRLTVVPYDSSSFAILQGAHNCIDFYDIKSQTIQRSVSVDPLVFVYFPPPVVLIRPSEDAEKRVLLQSLIGEKFELNLRTGVMEPLPCFISPGDRKINIESAVAALYDGEREFLDDVDEEGRRRYQRPVKDTVYLTDAAAIVDGVIFGDFEQELLTHDDHAAVLENRRSPDLEVSIYLLHMPIDKVHSLATLALNALNSRLSRDFRMLITKEVNPRSVAEMVNAVLRN